MPRVIVFYNVHFHMFSLPLCMEMSTVSILMGDKVRSYEDRYVTLLSLNIGKACRSLEHS